MLVTENVPIFMVNMVISVAGAVFISFVFSGNDFDDNAAQYFAEAIVVSICIGPFPTNESAPPLPPIRN